MSITICGQQCTTEQKNSGQRCGDPQVSYIGQVLDIYEVNGSSDSDFYAIVWDGANGIRTIEYASTRGWTYHNGASVDASASVQRMARESVRERIRTISIEQAHAMARMVRKGSMVRSTTTRGKNVGVEGIVAWEGIDRYKSTRWTTVRRFGVKVGDEKALRYFSEDQVERTRPDVIDVDDVIRLADHYVETSNFRSLVRYGG